MGPRIFLALDWAQRRELPSRLILRGSSYHNDALLGADECDLLVSLIRAREKAGIYGARITGGGSGGTVAVLADEGPRVDAALGDIMAEYERQTDRKPEAFTGTSPGAWRLGTILVPSPGTPGEG